MFILGVDPGLRSTGVAIAEKIGNSFRLKYLKEINTKSGRPLPERLYFIFNSLEKIVDKFNPSVLVLEKVYSHHRHPATVAVLSEVRGVIILLSAIRGLKFVEFPATQVKKSITSRGQASKDQMRKMVSYITGLDKPLSSQHLADALALVLAYLNTQKFQ